MFSRRIIKYFLFTLFFVVCFFVFGNNVFSGDLDHITTGNKLSTGSQGTTGGGGTFKLTGTADGGPVNITSAGDLPVMDTEAQLELGNIAENQWGVDLVQSKRETFWQQFKNNIAGSFKSMLSTFAKQFAYDTATWIASGGQGQQPLFITEGIDKYLLNTADSALGYFLDGLGERYGVDLCEPSFNVKLAIPGLLGERPTTPTVDCTFSEMADNWQTAIHDADFVVQYNKSLKPGENDLGTLLTIQSDWLLEKDVTERNAALEILSQDQWKSLKDKAGWVLTPGTMIREKWGISEKEAGESQKIFTGTIWDFVETFANTLVGTLLDNLMTGFFDSGSSNSSSNSGFDLDLPSLGSLFDSEAQPGSEGRAGAEYRFSPILSDKFRVGGPYDILNKLMQCTDEEKTNPGPTSCVIDELFASEIRNKSLVKKLLSHSSTDDNSIADRQFVPPANEVTDLKTAFTLRNILILRKYRIVPVGWEIAAKYIDQYMKDKYISLKDLITCFDPCDEYRGYGDGDFSGPNTCAATNEAIDPNQRWCQELVDPYWVLKAPEVFCRREGYGEHNVFIDSQNFKVNRSTYCSDEQQCLKEDDNGICEAYGYCTEDKKFWRLNGQICDPVYNTCEAMTNRAGEKVAYLKNTLDYTNCDESVVGCRWYSFLMNPVSSEWIHTESDKTLKICNNPAGCGSLDVFIDAGRSVYVDNNKYLRLDQPCSQSFCEADANCKYVSSQCRYDADICTIPFGGVTCHPDMVTQNNLLSSYNGDFSSCNGYDADFWTEGFKDQNNKHACSGGVLRSTSAGKKVVSFLTSIEVEENTDYTLSFSVEKISGQMAGGFSVVVLYKDYSSRDQVLDVSISSNGDYQVDIKNGLSDEITIQIITKEDTFGIVDFDDFELYQDGIGIDQGVTFGLGQEDVYNNGEIYFDRDAENCDANNEGCSQFIRTKAGLGSNLIKNPSFSLDVDGGGVPDYWSSAGLEYIGGKIRNNYTLGGTTCSSVELVKQVIDNLLPNKYYAISVSAAQYDANKANGTRIAIKLCNDSDCSDSTDAAAVDSQGSCTIGAGGHNQEVDLTFIPVGTEMERSSCTFMTNNKVDGAELYISATNSADCDGLWFDEIKLEEILPNGKASGFSDYDLTKRPDYQLSYIRKAPDYYNCYDSDPSTVGIQWPETTEGLSQVLQNRSSACSRFAPVCTPDEVGCELYTPINSDPAVPGSITSADICPKECVGYQVYHQDETDFTRDKYTQFIANDTSQYCSSAYAGCDEFTNLDDIVLGGEDKEYYKHLRVCQKPSDDDQVYYTWEGSDTTGYQLKTYKLKKSNQSNDEDSNGDGEAPCTNLGYDGGGNNKCIDENPDSSGDFLPSSYTLESYLQYLNNNKEDGDIIDPDLLNYEIIQGLNEIGICTPQEMYGYFYYDNKGNDLVADDVFVSVLQNSDCREFYDSDGNTYYRLLSRVVHSSENCHPYRRTQTQISLVDAEEDCQNSGGYWNSNLECIYMAIPGQGTTCPASAKGCRSYVGNRGNNIREVFSVDDFENGVGDWSYGTLSTMASYPGGQSLSSISATGLLSGQLVKPVYIQSRKTYVLSFWAKGELSSGNDFESFDLASVRFDDAPNNNDWFARSVAGVSSLTVPSVSITPEWKRYELGPVFVYWDGGNKNLEINIDSGHILYIDNVQLKETTNNIYLIENTWFTPFACDNKLDTPYGVGGINTPSRDVPGEMLGCSTYRDRASELWNLKSFDRLCRLEAVGCEAMIDTYNSDSPDSQSFNNGSVNVCIGNPGPCSVDGTNVCTITTGNTSCLYDNDIDDITVPADEMVYIVNDDKYNCKSVDKGCTAYGLPVINGLNEIIDYLTLYKKNQPDSYASILCKDDNLWCEEYIGTTNYYFKDPHGRLCEYREGVSGLEWFQKGTNILCDIDWAQTIGNSGIENDKLQPEGMFYNYTSTVNTSYDGWVGECLAQQSTCNEYIDPLDMFYASVVNSRDLKPGPNTIKLLPNILYSLSGDCSDPAGCDLKIVCNGINPILWSPDGSMKSYTNPAKLSVTVVSGSANGRFYIKDDNGRIAPVSCTLTTGGVTPSTIRIAEAGVYYYRSATIDSADCNTGLVDYDNGCILYNNRRSVKQSSLDSDRNLSYLTFDSYVTLAKGNRGDPQNDPISLNDSSEIIKSFPDRECKTWLYCTTYERYGDSVTGGQTTNDNPFFDNYDQCINLDLCKSFDQNKECNNLQLVNNGGSVAVDSYDITDVNKTGYSMLAYSFGGKKVSGYYPFNEVFETYSSTMIANGNFESIFGGTLQPIGWNTKVIGTEQPEWNDAMFRVEFNSDKSQEGIGYLRVNAENHVISEEISVSTSSDYYFSVWINTMGLLPDDGRANILIRNKDYSQVTPTQNNDPGHPGYRSYKSRTIVAGLDWIKVDFVIEAGGDHKKVLESGTVFIEIYNSAKTPPASGFSLFDDIQMKPVLEVSGNENITRSCRIYPESDSRSCNYIDGNNVYYGKYGYCMLRDPANSKQCLQWMPIDRISGELSEEVSGYNGRVPLYYCVEKQSFDLKIGTSGTLQRVTSEAEKYTGGLLSDTGNTMQLLPFNNIPDDYRALVRFPYVDEFKFCAWGVSVTDDFDYLTIVIPASVTMRKNRACYDPLDFCLGAESAGSRILSELDFQQREDRLKADVAAAIRALPDGDGVVEPNDCKTKQEEYATRVEGWTAATGEELWQYVKDSTKGCRPVTCAGDNPNFLACKVIGSLLQVARDRSAPLAWDGTWNQESKRLVEIKEASSAADAASAEEGGFFDLIWEAILNDVGVGLEYSGTALDVSESCVGTGGPFSIPWTRPADKKEEWGGFGLIPIAIDLGAITGISLPIPIALVTFIPISWNDITDPTVSSVWMSILTYLGNNDPWGRGGILGEHGVIHLGPFFGGKVVLDYDERYGDMAPDPIPDMDGDILGLAWFIQNHPQTDAIAVLGSIQSSVAVSYCNKMITAVTSAGDNKAYISRIFEGSSYSLSDPDALSLCIPPYYDPAYNYQYNDPFDYRDMLAIYPYYCSSDYRPFGALVQPSNAQYPSQWDSKTGAYKQPLLYEPARTGAYSAPYQARMGENHSTSSLKLLFAKNYGTWQWRWYDPASPPDTEKGGWYYYADTSDSSNVDWGMPTWQRNSRTDANCNQDGIAGRCLVRPRVKDNIKVSAKDSNGNQITTHHDNKAYVNNYGSVKLEFNILVDQDQIPLNQFTVDWGDGNSSSVGGVTLNSRPNPENPFTLYHFYDYWQVEGSGAPCAKNGDYNECSVEIKVKDLRDSWGGESNSGGEESIKIKVRKRIN